MFQKVIFSSNPSTSSTSDFTVATLVGYNLAIAVPGKSKWNLLERRHYRDIMFNKNGTLICTTSDGAIHGIKLEDYGFRINGISAPFVKNHPSRLYVAEDCYGRMYLITRELDILETTYTLDVKVYRRDDEGNAWQLMNGLDINGQALFVGTNAAFAIKKEDVVKGSDIKPDTVYFTNDWWDVASNNVKQSRRDICAYSLADNSIELCYPSDLRQKTWPFPVWIDFRNLN